MWHRQIAVVQLMAQVTWPPRHSTASLPVTEGVGHVTGKQKLCPSLPKTPAALAHILINQNRGYLFKPILLS